jgi:hypothetical protein
MALIGEKMNLLDWAKRTDPDGKAAAIVNILNQTNEVLDDAVWLESNLPTGHRTTVRTDLPDPTWRKLNYGIKPTKSKTKQVDDTIGILEIRGEVDRDLAELNGEISNFRMNEDQALVESLNQTMAGTLIYGDTDENPERFMGLSPRYPYSDSPNVLDAGGSGDDTSSVWIVTWGPNTAHLVFPKGSKAGLRHEDLGPLDLEDADGGKYRGYASWYQWKAGLVVRDWRYVVRIANVETSGASSIITPDLIVEGLNKLPNPGMGKTVIYMNRTIKTQLHKAALNKSNAAFTFEDVFGRPVTKFWGFPVRQVDAILNTETALSAAPA